MAKKPKKTDPEQAIQTETITADLIRFHVGRIMLRCKIGQEILGAQLEVIVQQELDQIALQVTRSFAAVGRQMVSVHRSWPATWWDAFKERWFPGWWLRRWPAEYQKLDIERLVYAAVCPHLMCDNQRDHIHFLVAKLPTSEARGDQQ